MIAKRYRFHGYGSLNHTYKHGQIIRSEDLSLKYAPNTRRHQYRLAVVVSKKVSPSAVVRNRIRRRLYEAVRVNIADSSEPYDLILSVFSSKFANLPSEQINQAIATTLKKAGVINQGS